jgi:hypothetical protein
LVIVKRLSSDIMAISYLRRASVISRSKTKAQVKDWITPSQVEIIKIKPPAERLEWLARRAQELKEAMGSRDLCHENNRVRRLDGRSYQAHQVTRSNARSLKRSA